MNSRKNRIKRGGGHGYSVYVPVRERGHVLPKFAKFDEEYDADILDEGAEGLSETFKFPPEGALGILQGGTKRRSRKSRKGKKTKKGSGVLPYWSSLGIREIINFRIKGGTKRRSRKSRKAKKTKKGRVAYEGGKKKCPKHCRRKTRHTRKGLKHRKN